MLVASMPVLHHTPAVGTCGSSAQPKAVIVSTEVFAAAQNQQSSFASTSSKVTQRPIDPVVAKQIDDWSERFKAEFIKVRTMREAERREKSVKTLS